MADPAGVLANLDAIERIRDPPSPHHKVMLASLERWRGDLAVSG